MTKTAGARASAFDATVKITNKGDDPEIVALKAKVERQREHLAGAELALAQAIARKENA